MDSQMRFDLRLIRQKVRNPNRKCLRLAILCGLLNEQRIRSCIALLRFTGVAVGSSARRDDLSRRLLNRWTLGFATRIFTSVVGGAFFGGTFASSILSRCHRVSIWPGGCISLLFATLTVLFAIAAW